MKLSHRLSTLRSYHDNAPSVWDIGCDHGQLGLSFTDSLTVRTINLVDPSSKVISVLKNTIDAYITKKDFQIIIHEKRGQEVVLGSERKTVFIAGMGGKEIKDILTHLNPQLRSDDRVVISPHRKILELRKYLSTSKFKLIDEQVLMEDQQYYQILCLSLAGELPGVGLYGEKLFRDGVGPLYLEHQKHTFEGHKDAESMAYFAYLKSL